MQFVIPVPLAPMSRAFKAVAVALVLAVSLVGSVAAGPREDAVAAFDRGDHATAVQLLRSLAERGNAWAQHVLGFMYWTGDGVPQDYVLAHMWFNLAAASGYEGAAHSRNTVVSWMTPEQIAEAQKLAREWKPK